MNEEELKHFGVVGMKWGVRKNPSKTYAKASKKLSKLDKKVEKRTSKVDKAIRTYNRSAYGFGPFRNVEKATAKVGKAQYKQEKALRKADKWMKAMESSFANTDVKFSDADVAKGKSYVAQLGNLKSIKLSKLYA